MNANRIGNFAHDSAKGIHFTHQMSLAMPPTAGLQDICAIRSTFSGTGSLQSMRARPWPPRNRHGAPTLPHRIVL